MLSWPVKAVWLLVALGVPVIWQLALPLVRETLSPAGPEHRSDPILDLMARAGSNSRYREILNSPTFAAS